MRNYFLFVFVLFATFAKAQEIYEMPKNVSSRLSSFENLNGVKGSGGKTNQSAKGNAFEMVQPGETKTLLDISGQGIIQRMCLTIDQNPVKLRSLRLQMFWDKETKPAVDVPFGDFFVYNLGKQVAFQSAFFTTGEGRSFNCYIPMPFKKAARILLTNEGKEPVKLFFDVDFILKSLNQNALYFHAYWHRQDKGKLGEDHVILPKISGKGRFLGVSVGLNTDSSYGKSWWGEGEVKMFIDDDTKYPTIVGTGAEDYIGSAWGLGQFMHQYQGCTVANDSTRQFNFYRWHVPDEIYFDKDIRVSIQQIGGWGKKDVADLIKKGALIKPITIDAQGKFVRLLEMEKYPELNDPSLPDGWVNFFRVDDYASVAYLYLDKPASNLPALQPLAVRINNVK